MDVVQGQYIVDSTGTKTAVILTIEQYEQLLQDLHDLAAVAERRSEQSISLAEMKKSCIEAKSIETCSQEMERSTS